MIVERIRNLNITKRPIFTGLYGCTFSQEYFVENNLCKYNSWQELYRYLRGEGYTTVFYNESTNFFSYEENQLETLFFKKPEEIAQEVESSSGSDSGSNAQGRYVSQFASPNGHNRRRGIRLTNGDNRVPNDTTGGNNSTEQTPSRDQTSTAVVSHNPGIIAFNNEVDHYFQLQSREGLNRIFRFMDVNPGHKLAIVFTMPTKVSFGQQEPRLLTDLQERFSKQKHAGSGLRLIVLYDYKEVTQLYEEFQSGNAFFNDNWIKNQLFPDHQDGRSDLHKPSPALFHVGSMGKDEVANMLNRQRVLKGLQHTFAPIPFDDLCSRICQQFIVVDPETEKETSVETVAEFMDLDIPDVERTILRMEQEKAINKLKRMLGIDKLIEQFEKYVKAFRRSQKNKKSAPFRPHMAFMGNPGTGKTTVARLFADRLREEGLLSRGQFVEAKPGDLIAEHIGGTRIKTQAVCDRARGGVLFIDEAYGLMSGANDNGNTDFGQEAIEVLIQFMENNKDSLVIVAGYTEDIQRLINEGNKGFRSRFNEKHGFFHFEDYEPDVLYQIAKKNIPEEIQTTQAFDKALHDIIVLKHAYRTKKFGNARDMENLASTIVSTYEDAEVEGHLDIIHLPDDLRVLVDPSMLKEDIMLAELNDTIVGQENIKKIVKDLYVRCLAERTKMSNIEGYKPELQRLNYIFAGNPGTGKTTIARIIGNLLHKMGVLSSNDDAVLTEVSGGDVANMSPAQIQALFEGNIGKVLFVDEAYMLGRNEQSIGQIVQNITDPDYENKLCLILAGYTTEMHQMMSLNPGTFSRFTEVLFQDYTNKELWEILKRKINAPDSQYAIDEVTCRKTAINYFARQSRGLHFGNARIIDDPLLPHLKTSIAKRYVEAPEELKKDPDFAKRILSEDFPPIVGGVPDLDLTPMERLNRLEGIGKIREQFERYRDAFKHYRDGKGGSAFRPHMAFMGNPGTGKTTVARLFGEILHEDGLLPQGQFVEATVGDLIGQYIGQTRIKAGALCDRARGGVLFIDEAYGLISGVNPQGNVDFGQEAIEVLIQFMENSNDSLVILAGYPKETMKLINEGNPGFKSRFNEGLGFFFFEDYEPDVLFKIARSNILKSVTSTTESFDKALKNIVVLKHAYRTKVFGNARDMENLANTITSAYYDARATGSLDVEHLPERLRILVDPTMLNEETMLAELNAKIVGQENIKSVVRNLFYNCLAERTRMAEIEGYKPRLQRLNYVFAGNPGTGKTTIARIIGNLLQKMGVLSCNDESILTEVSGGDVANMRPAQIQDLFEDNIGKVLFIDEAYMLGHNEQSIGQIVQNITNPDYENKLCLILAGYTTEMHEMMRLNPGMSSRVEEVIFQDYTDEELWEILKRKINAPDSRFSLDEDACEEKALNYFASLERGIHFGNARIIDAELLPHLILEQGKRYAKATPEQRKEPDFALKILPEDFPATRRRKKALPPTEKLNKMLGIDNIRKQFKRYRDAYKRYIKGEVDVFRPHMAFMGNPGTGKTTVARLFGAILHEDGLLPQGQFVEAKVGDLVGQYIGQTRVKAGALCDRAKGGVLFIDEAYGLMSGAGVHGADYGQEAIEVLIQFMENNDDSLVILAGYPEETKRLINEGNPGFKSRFNESLGFFYFEDYEPDVLYEIARKNIPESIKTTPAFDKALRDIIVLKHAYRTRVFGNARDMENLAGTIISAYYDAETTEALDVRHLPDKLRVLVDPTMLDENVMLAELNQKIVGQQGIKEIVKNLYINCLGGRQMMTNLEGYQPELQRLNFLFLGNPGTGKTTIARIIGNLLQKIGVLSSNDDFVLTETKGSEVAQMSSEEIKKLFEDNIGKVLFIDEAYGMRINPRAINDIVGNLTNPDYENKLCLILAGYTTEMHDLLRDNSGMASRFDEVRFQDYSNEELWEILKRKVSADPQCLMDEDACRQSALNYIKSQPRGPRFGNARIIDALLLLLKTNLKKRYIEAAEEQKVNSDFAKRILPEDFPQDKINAGMSDEEVLRELNDLIGLQKVKETIRGIIQYVKAQQRLLGAGQTHGSQVGLNFVFRGNPGTGKTTVARLLGNILANYGLISDSEVVTYTKGQLVDRYVGSGSQNVERMFEDSVGKVLFIDEAYQLADHESGDALNALTNMMTDERFKDRLAIVLAGYHGQMSELINSNPGLHSRFTQYVDFDDYSNDELTEIFRKKLEYEDFVIGEEALAHARAYFSSLSRNINFGNGREAEKLLGIVKTIHGGRILGLTNCTKEELFTILPEDFPNYGRINADAFLSQQGSSLSPMDKLYRLSGIDRIREQFVTYLKKARYFKEHPQDELSDTFRPHMAFMGNPGTGKTTVAKLFGEILRAEGLLNSNNFVALGPADLIGRYVGESAQKARRQFERAKGGILFIDEAYELYKKGKEGGGNQYGQEVITELITFMENKSDSDNAIVILAGYTDELTHMIKYGNAGFESRVTNEFVFEDYQPDILFEILLKKLGSHETTEQFKDDMLQIIQYEFAHRDEKRWGNARTMENHANAIFGNYLVLHNAEGPIDCDCIPDHLRQCLTLFSAQQGTSTSTTTSSQPTIPSALLSIDLTKNPADRRVTNKRQLREQATGLLHSSGGEGTGFIISIPDRYIMTCSHVIEDTESDIFFRMNCNKEFETMAHVVWNNHDQDMALLQLDEMPEDACYVQIDCDIEHNPDPSDAEEKIKLLLCSYPAGSDLASTPSFSEGKINNFEKQRHWNERCFDTILTSINATHGCSGGPVVRESDFMLVGLLQGGKVDTNIQFITDIHQLFKNKNLDIKS